MLFYITQAAQQNGAELIAVKGYALKDLPGDREYVEGPAEYIFKLERASHREAYHAVDVLIRGCERVVKRSFL